ncbi:hypothetical protein [Symbiopectobacterium sp. RP]
MLQLAHNFNLFTQYIAKRLKNDYIQCPDMWQKIQLIVIKIMSLGYTLHR